MEQVLVTAKYTLEKPSPFDDIGVFVKTVKRSKRGGDGPLLGGGLLVN